MTFEPILPKRSAGSCERLAMLRSEIDTLRLNAKETESYITANGEYMSESKLSSLRSHLYDLTQAIEVKQSEYDKELSPEPIQTTIDHQ